MKIFSKTISVSCCLLLLCSHVKIHAEESAIPKTTGESARQKLLSFFAGEWISRGIYVVTKLEIADLLQPSPKSIEELATLSHANPDSLHRLLGMLSSFGIFEEVMPGVFANTEMSLLLTKTQPDTLHSLSLFYGEDINKSWSEIFSSIQTGTPAFDLSFKKPVFRYFKENPDRASLFQQAMKEKSKAVIASSLSTYDFGKFAAVCDVGGGYGQFIGALLQKHTHLSGTVFELPEVVEKIKMQNTSFESDRSHLAPGDFFKSVPSGFDAYILKSVIHDWDDKAASEILKNCSRAMRKDSRLLLVEVVLGSGDNRSYASCMDFLMLGITGGKERTLSSMTKLLENAGFVIENVYPTSTEFSVIEAKKLI